MTIPYLRSIERGCDRTEILSNDHSAKVIVGAGTTAGEREASDDGSDAEAVDRIVDQAAD